SPSSCKWSSFRDRLPPRTSHSRSDSVHRFSCSFLPQRGDGTCSLSGLIVRNGSWAEELEVSISSPLLPPTADILADIAGGPSRARKRHLQCGKETLLDEPIGKNQDRIGYLKADQLGGFQVDHQLQFGWSLDR